MEKLMKGPFGKRALQQEINQLLKLKNIGFILRSSTENGCRSRNYEYRSEMKGDNMLKEIIGVVRSTGQGQALPLRFVQIIAEHPPAVLIFVTVYAEVLPVGAVGRVVLFVAVFMVHGKQVAVFQIELPAALGAYEPVYLQGTFPVAAGRGSILLQFPDKLFSGLAFAGLFRTLRPAAAV